MKLWCDKCDKEIEGFTISPQIYRPDPGAWFKWTVDVSCHGDKARRIFHTFGGEFYTGGYGTIHFFEKDESASREDIENKQRELNQMIRDYEDSLDVSETPDILKGLAKNNPLPGRRKRKLVKFGDLVINIDRLNFIEKINPTGEYYYHISVDSNKIVIYQKYEVMFKAFEKWLSKQKIEVF